MEQQKLFTSDLEAKVNNIALRHMLFRMQDEEYDAKCVRRLRDLNPKEIKQLIIDDINKGDVSWWLNE